MISVYAYRPLNRVPTCCPGPVASVGDVNMGQKLKSTYPGDFRAGENYGEEGSRVGSSAQDGANVGYNGGGPARVFNDSWNSKRGFKTRIGWFQQDIRAPDKLMTPLVGSLPQYSWLNKVARIKSNQGDLFQNRQNLVQRPNGPMRGGMYPRVTNTESGQEPPVMGLQNNPDNISLDLPTPIVQPAVPQGIGRFRPYPRRRR